MSILYIIIAILMLSFIVTVHEFGHYLVGRLCGIGIKEFSIGFGPRLIGFERKGIKYSLRIILLGGYCSFVGEDESNSDPRAMNNQPVWKRFLTVLAGPAMNFILAYVFCVIYLCGFQTAEYLPRISALSENMPAIECGMENGDIITAINGQNISFDMQGVQDLHTILDNADLNNPVEFTLKRGNETITISLIPEYTVNEETGTASYLIGIALGGRNFTLGESIGSSFGYMFDLTKSMLGSLRDLIFKGQGADGLMGTVGIISFVSDEIRDYRLQSVVMWIFFLSLNIGILNLLPIPALDGGRLLFLIIEAIRRKPIPPEKEGMVHLIGFALLFALFIVITYKDIARLVTGG